MSRPPVRTSPSTAVAGGRGWDLPRDRGRVGAVEPLSDRELLKRIELYVISTVAEAEMRGMTPLAVFFEWIDDLRVSDPKLARKIEQRLPRDTVFEYRQWRGEADPAE